MRIHWLVLLLLGSLAAPAAAVSTRTFRVTSYADFDAGEAKGVLISSLGELTTGFATRHIDLPAAFVRCSVEGPGGAVYLGTGVQGEVWVLEGGKVRKLGRLPDVVEVSALAVGPDGTVYAGSTPGGRVFAIKGTTVREVAKLDADHVWALEWDAAKKTLYAGTGAQGKLFAIELPSGKNRVLWSSGQKHLRSLLRDRDGSLWVGTGDEAILFHVMPDGHMRAVHDFDGEEIRALAMRDGTLYVAVNQFEKGSTPPASSSATPPLGGTKITLPQASTTPQATAAPGQRKGKGAVYRIDQDGRVEQMHALSDGYFTALVMLEDGSLLAASGSQGKVFLLKPDRTIFTAFDFPERQVLTLVWTPKVRLLGTGDAGGLYEVLPGAPKEAVYTSKVFDAEFPSRLGTLRWHASGPVRFETRTGNTSKPDKSWSAWEKLGKAEKVLGGGAAHMASPQGRYVQFRILFDGAATVRDVQTHYLPQNQRARVTEIQAGDEPQPKPSGGTIGSATPLASIGSSSSAATTGRTRSSVVKVRWKVENPDGDELVYRLYFREEDEANWKPLGGTNHEPLTKTEYDWNTEAVPDGNYVIRVEASDERANPVDLAMQHGLTSQPFLVDNRKPEIAELDVHFPTARGRARDSFSPIQELAYSIDGGDWHPLQPTDGILDDLSEAFTLRLPDKLTPGAHTLAIRAADAADNLGAAQVTFRVK